MALIKDQTRLKNRLHTQTLTISRRQTKARLAQVERQLKAIEDEIETRLERDQARALDILKSIPGVGTVSATSILIECPEIGTLGRKQIVSLSGLVPMTRQSGQWRGTAFIQGGRKFLRAALYMPALVATRFNPDMKAKYQTMRKAGKPAKVAITTIMRKLTPRAIPCREIGPRRSSSTGTLLLQLSETLHFRLHQTRMILAQLKYVA
ncbi:transposase [Labrenzia sp. EL_208]|nr:transposase [Labrenzia sp. EL_132]MBG6230702.1 transposase [Labrenzia sp. EL_208]